VLSAARRNAWVRNLGEVRPSPYPAERAGSGEFLVVDLREALGIALGTRRVRPTRPDCDALHPARRCRAGWRVTTRSGLWLRRWPDPSR
jgi:hypothetical protein